MSATNRLDRTVFCNFPYPVYQLKAIGPGILLAAGGGGSAKTGVPNRIDVVSIPRSTIVPQNLPREQALIPPNISIIGGVETQSEAVMHMALSVKSSSAAVLLTLEGSTCQEYLVCPKTYYRSPVGDINKAGESIEQDFKISSSDGTVKSYSSSSEEALTTSTTPHRNRRDKSITEKSAQVTSKKDSLEGSWICRGLRCVSVSPTTALMERRRLDSCSSTNSTCSPTGQFEDELNCIATGGPGDSWCAVGTLHGGVAIIDRYANAPTSSAAAEDYVPFVYRSPTCPPSSPSYHFTYDHGALDIADDSEDDCHLPLRPVCALSDVSGGRCAVVCDVALSVASFSSRTASEDDGSGSGEVPLIPLLASVSGKPLGSLLCIWRLQQVQKGDAGSSIIPSLQAEVRLAPTPVTKSNRPVHLHPNENSTRFRHCEFLRWAHQQPELSSSNLFIFLVTTEQPVSPSGKSVCQLSTWLVPLQQAQQVPLKHPPLPVATLERFASIDMPRGQLPACIAVHPSRRRGIIALGSMEGSVDVYVIALEAQRLVHVYSMPTAHPIFVTSLSFLPPREVELQSTVAKDEHLQFVEPHYDLVSASADRVLRWHPGPSMQRVIAATATSVSKTSLKVWKVMFLCLLPLLLSLFDRALNHLDCFSSNA